MDFSGSEIFWPTTYEILSEMGPYGSVGAHIKTGRSPMAQDHFKTPPDPKNGPSKSKNDPKRCEGRAKRGPELLVFFDCPTQRRHVILVKTPVGHGGY